MNNLKFLAAFAAATLAVAVAGAASPANSVTYTRPDGSKATVTAISDNIIKVSPGTAPTESRIALTPKKGFTGQISEALDHATILTPTGLRVDVNKVTGELSVNGGNGRAITDSGVRRTDAKGRHALTLATPGNPRHVYGGGERGYSFNLYGDTLEVYNTQNYGYTEGDPRIKRMNITMPMLIYPDGYAVLFDDIAAAEMLQNDSLSYATEAPAEPAYYFINSPAGFPGVTTAVTELVGRQELPPFWSLAYITSKYGYHTEDEARGAIDSLRTAGYPVDGMVLDLYWYGKEQDMGRLAWEPEQWPDPTKMLADLKAQGVNMVAISQPFVLKNGKALPNFEMMDKARMFGRDSLGNTREVTIWVGEGGMFDMSNPDTRAWLRQRYKELTDSGMTGWWGDLGEPEAHPADMIHANGLKARQYHNYYGNDWSSIIYNLFAEEYPETRLMALMRGGTTGLQRYSVFPWSTDVSRSWGGLQPQVKIMLNSGLSGLGYMSHDVGGFAIDKENPIDPELYVRWLQLGLFSPVFRTHSQLYAEPYHYPAQHDILLPLVKRRYSMLPYTYTLAWENATTGTPLVRPVGFYEKNPAATDSIVNEFLFGRDMLVAPVLTQGTTERSVYFPEEGTVWVDVNTPAKTYKGGTTATVAAPLDVIPVYVRAGSIIPSAPYEMKNVSDYNPARYTFDYYPGGQSGETSYTLFEDDRTSRSSLPAGKFALLNVSANNMAASTVISVMSEGSYEGMPAQRELTFVLHGFDAPKSVTVNGTPLKYSYDKAARTLTVDVPAAELPLSVIVDK